MDTSTQIKRVMLLQEFAVVIERCQEMDRMVQIYTPPSGVCYLLLDQTGEDVGLSRVYKGCPLPNNFPTTFILRAGQFVSMAVESGQEAVTIILECLLPGEKR